MHAFPLFPLTVAPPPLGSPYLDPVAATVAPIPEVGFVLQCAAVGTAVGSVIALRAKRRRDDADTWSITTAWATLGLVVGLMVAFVSVVG